MKTAKVRVVLQLPEILTRPLPDDASDDQKTDVLRALFDWAGVAAPTDIRSDVLAGSPWTEVALRLAIEALPCFGAVRRRTRKKGGAPKRGSEPELKDLESDTYLAAGGTLLAGDPESLQRHQQALFVLAVRKAKGNRTLGHAFRHLAKNNAELPARYRRLRTAKSLESAYKDVPRIIRDDPSSAIPTVSPLAALIGAALLRPRSGPKSGR